MPEPARKRRSGYLYKRTPDGKQIRAKDRRRGTFYLQYDLAGKRYRVSLGTTNREKAEQKQMQIMAPFQVADEQAAIGAMKQRLEAADDKLREIDDKRHPPVGIEDAWHAFLSSPSRPDSGPRTLRDYERQWDAFTSWLGKNHPTVRLMRDVTFDIAQGYAVYLLSEVKTKVKSKGRKEGRQGERIVRPAYNANTYNKHVRLLGLMFRVLRGKAKTSLNPWLDIARKTGNGASRRELTVDEINTIVNKAEGELQKLFILGIYTGMRLGDCCTLRWSEIDLVRRMILRVPNKTARRKNTPMHIPIHPTLLAVLNETPAAKRKGDLFPELAAKYRRSNSDVCSIIQNHLKSCEIQIHREGTGKGTGKRAVVEVGFHSLRHSFVSLCRESNAPLAVVEAMVGHSNPAITRHYTHVGDLAASQAVAALPVFTGANGSSSLATSNHRHLSPRDEKIMAILEKSTAKTWKKDRNKVVKLILGR